MIGRCATVGLAAAPAVLRGHYQLFAQSNAPNSARAVRLIESSVVVDLLNQFQFPDFAVKPPYVAKLVGVEHVAIGSDLDVVGDPDGAITIRGVNHSKRCSTWSKA